MSVFRFARDVVEGSPITIYGDGTQQRDYTYVTDVARGTMQALTLKGYETINLGRDRPVAVNAVVRLVERLWAGHRLSDMRRDTQPMSQPHGQTSVVHEHKYHTFQLQKHVFSYKWCDIVTSPAVSIPQIAPHPQSRHNALI